MSGANVAAVVGPRLPLTGGCGAVRFEISEPFASANYCHCTRCQRRTGTAASANGRTAPGSFQLLSGEEHLRAWAPEGGAEKVFCGLCGSAVFSRTAGDPPAIGVRLGSLDADPGSVMTAALRNAATGLSTELGFVQTRKETR